jgi:hypothetical protein
MFLLRHCRRLPNSFDPPLPDGCEDKTAFGHQAEIGVTLPALPASNQGAIMNRGPASLPTDEELQEVALSLQGYTVSARGMCLTRIGAEYVMRDGARRCVRVPVGKVDQELLGTTWSQFGRPDSQRRHVSAADKVTWDGTVSPHHVAIVLQGFAGGTRGLCLVRVAGNYVTHDGQRHSVSLLVDTVDPVALDAAWAAFSKVAGWMSPTSVEGAGTSDRSADEWYDTGEKRWASG